MLGQSVHHVFRSSQSSTESWDKLFHWALIILLSFIIYHITKVVNKVVSLILRKSSPPFDAKLPYKPNSHWLFGNLPDLFGKGPAGIKPIMVDIANENGISTFWILNKPCVSMMNPKDAQRVLKSSVTRDRLSFMSHHTDRFIGPNSIVTIPGGNKWKVSRNVVHRAFTPEALNSYQACMNMLADVFASTIVRTIDERSTKNVSENDGYVGPSPDGNGIILEYLRVFKMITIDVIGMAAFGCDFECSRTLTSSKYALAFEYLQEEFVRRVQKDMLSALSWFYFIPTQRNRKQKKSVRLLRDFLLKIVRERRIEHGGGADASVEGKIKNLILLDYLIGATDSDKLTDQMLSDSLLTLLAAGYETSSITLTYACYLLATHPEADELCAQEARAVLGEPGSPISKDIDSNQDLLYCRAVVYEALRLFPPATMTSRCLEKPMKLQEGVTLPGGTRVFLPIYWIHRDPKNFPNPEKFAPERWVTRSANGKWMERPEVDDENIRAGEKPNESGIPSAKRDAFLAFSAGARSCVGRRFAMQETTVVLAACVRNLKWEVMDGYVVEHRRNGLTHAPRNGMPLITRKREVLTE